MTTIIGNLRLRSATNYYG